LSGRGLCGELITRPEESYRLCCVVVCDLETSRMGAPYIYDIYHLRGNVHGSLHRNNILVYKSQQDAHVTEFILSDNCSTCCRTINYSITVTRCCSYGCFVLLKTGDTDSRNM